jgi:hypothetical protein
MNAIEIIFSASEWSNPIGKGIFLFSGSVISFNTIFQNLIPTIIIDASVIWLIACLIGTGYFFLKYRNIPNISAKECPRCGSKMSYTGAKCIDEKTKGCTLTVRFK